MITLVAVFVGLGHSVLAMSGEESLAQVYREIEHPKLPNLKKAALVIFIYSMVFTSLVSFFAVMIIPDKTRPQYFENLIGGLAMSLTGPFVARLIFHVFVVVVGTLILSGAVNTAIVGSNGVLNRVSEDGVLSDWFRQPHPQVRHFAPHHQYDRDPADRHDPDQPRRRDVPREPLRVRRDLELCAERHRGAGAALHAPAGPRIPRAAEFHISPEGNPARPGADHADAAWQSPSSISSPSPRPPFRASSSPACSSRHSKFPRKYPERKRGEAGTSSSISSIWRRKPI